MKHTVKRWGRKSAEDFAESRGKCGLRHLPSFGMGENESRGYIAKVMFREKNNCAQTGLFGLEAVEVLSR